MAFSTGRWQRGDDCRTNRLPARPKVDAAIYNTGESSLEDLLESVIDRPN